MNELTNLPGALTPEQEKDLEKKLAEHQAAQLNKNQQPENAGQSPL